MPPKGVSVPSPARVSDENVNSASAARQDRVSVAFLVAATLRAEHKVCKVCYRKLPFCSNEQGESEQADGDREQLENVFQ